MSQSPNITLCVIVKDQESLLRRLLEHHREMYDEAVVVDTGSSDGSVLAATQLGAVVGNFPWADDFSAARNHALDMATGEWILVLDCDEIMASRDFASVRKMTEHPADRCFTLPQLNYFPTKRGTGWEPTRLEDQVFALNAPGYLTAWTIRLFPNLESVRYQGLVHENLDKTAQSAGLAIHRLDLPIHHQGHLPAHELDNHRVSFYGRLLQKKIAAHPEDPQARYEMATHLAGVGQTSLAVRLLEKTLTDFPGWKDRYRAGLLLGQIKFRQGEVPAAAQIFQEALESRPDWSACWESVIKCQLSLNKLEAAGRYLAQARRLFPLRPVWEGFEAQVSGKCGR